MTITDNEIRTLDVSELRHRYNLDYIVSEYSRSDRPKTNKKIALVAHVNYTKLIDYCFDYINQVPYYVDIYITTKGEENISIISEKIRKMNRENIRVVVPEDRGREISALLVACKDYLMQYDYLCFVHDKKKNRGEPYLSVGQSFCDILWENTLKNGSYIENVIDLLEREEKLGFLGTPSPYESAFFTIGFFPWCASYRQTKMLSERLQLNCVMSEQNQPFIVGTTFWCKTDALKPLFEANLKYEDFVAEPMPEDDTISHGIERILPYVAQSQGYYSGIVMTSEYASLYKTNYRYMIERILKDIILPYDRRVQSFDDTLKEHSSISNFIEQTDHLYIYGAGMYGRRCLEKIRKISPEKECSFVVSQCSKIETVDGCKVCAIDQLDDTYNPSVIIAMKYEYVLQVLSVLKAKNIKNVIIFEEEM